MVSFLHETLNIFAHINVRHTYTHLTLVKRQATQPNIFTFTPQGGKLLR